MSTHLDKPRSEALCALCRLGVAALIAGLPALCLAYCELAAGASSASLDWRARTAHHHHLPTPQDEHAPLLSALQALLRTAVECLPTGEGWCVAPGAMAAPRAVRLLRPARINPQPPVPPPRHVRSWFHFLLCDARPPNVAHTGAATVCA